jgi:hypothetical protein
MLVCCSCGRKPAPVSQADSAPAPAAATIENVAASAPAPAPPPPVPVPSAEPAASEAAAPPANEDPVTLQQRQDLAELNAGLKAFIARNQRLPKDMAELAASINSLPLPPERKMWVIDAPTKSVKAVPFNK